MNEPPGPTAKSLTLHMLSTLAGATLPAAALVEAAHLFGVQESAVRVALARLVAAGRVARDGSGRYRPGRAAEPVVRRVAGWRRASEGARPWDGDWLGVHTAGLAPRPSPRQVRRRSRALRLLGFEALAPGLAIRPNNLRGGAAGVRDELAGLGLEAGALVFELGALDPATDARARGLWDVAALCSGYRRSLAELAASERRLQVASEPEAMVESFLVGGRVIRQLVLDPLLPEPLLPAAERDALVDALDRYHRLARACWAAFLARHGGAAAPPAEASPAGEPAADAPSAGARAPDGTSRAAAG